MLKVSASDEKAQVIRYQLDVDLACGLYLEIGEE